MLTLRVREVDLKPGMLISSPAAVGLFKVKCIEKGEIYLTDLRSKLESEEQRISFHLGDVEKWRIVVVNFFDEREIFQGIEVPSDYVSLYFYCKSINCWELGENSVEEAIGRKWNFLEKLQSMGLLFVEETGQKKVVHLKKRREEKDDFNNTLYT